MNKRTILPMAMLALLASCSSEMDEIQQADNKFEGQVTIKVSPFEFGEDTRTTLTLDTDPTTGKEQLTFGWKDTEEIGVFPVNPKSNSQAHHLLNSYDNQGTITYFDGGGWSLTRGYTYAAYYPFDVNMKVVDTYEDIKLNMTGQIQNGNGTLQHIGDGYDYMYSCGTVPESGDMVFHFNHVTSIVQINLTMPVAANWTKVTLVNKDNSKVFITEAKMNATNGAITPTATASSVTLDLNNVKTTADNMKLTLYLAVLPTTTGEVVLTASTDGTYDYYVSLPSKTFRTGKAYRWTATVSNALYARDGRIGFNEYIDLGLSKKWATKNIDAITLTDFGGYYAWGETEEKENYDFRTYKFSPDGAWNSLSKYTFADNQENSSWYDNGTFIGDNIKQLSTDDDVAYVKTNGLYRMPTGAELKELYTNCSYKFVTNYCGTNINGFVFFKKGASIPSSDEFSVPHIFLPAAGYKTIDNKGNYIITAVNIGSEYWSSTLSNRYSDSGTYFWGNKDDSDVSSTRRSDGQPIRPVLNE